MGRLDDRQRPLFYAFCLEGHVPQDHLLRRVALVLDLSRVRQQLAPYYSEMGRPSLDPEFMIGMLLVRYLYGILSERRLAEEVHLNLAYRWFCGLGLEGRVPERSSFSKTRHKADMTPMLARVFSCGRTRKVSSSSASPGNWVRCVGGFPLKTKRRRAS